MIDLEFMEDLTREAGKALLGVYNDASGSEAKGNRSPFESAREQAHRVIFDGLRSRYPDVPIISEEEKNIRSTSAESPRFWLIDPLDGIQGFTRKNDEFTVNISLVEGETPVLGAVYHPVSRSLYLAVKGAGTWKVDNGTRRQLRISAPLKENPVRVVIGRTDRSPDTISLLGLLPSCLTVSRGSAMKFCAIAEGEIDFYPRLDPTWEWKTAAGQAIVAEAGGVTTGISGEPFTYHKPGFLNGPFLVASGLSWLKELELLDYSKRLAELPFEDLAKSCR